MKPTKFVTLLIAFVISAAATFAIVKAVVANGGGVPVAPTNLLISIPAIAVIELLAAIPVFRYRRELAKYSVTGKRPKRIDPFYAVRILALSKATAISGALFSGFAASLVLLQATLPILPDSIWLNVVALVESVLLIVVAMIIERACKLPEDSDPADAKTTARPGPEVTPA